MDNTIQALNLGNDDFLSFFSDAIDFNYSVIDCDGNYLVQNEQMIKNISQGLANAGQVNKAAWENCKKVIKEKKKVIVEEKFKDRHYLSIKQPLFDNGKCLGIRILSLEITDRKQAKKLQVEKEAAEKSAKTLEKVSGLIAHEMKTPLAIINLNNDFLGIDLAKKDLDLNSKDERSKLDSYYGNIKFAVSSANTVIGMLLTKLSHLATPKLGPSDFEFQSIKSTIDAAIEEYPFLKMERILMHWEAKANPDFKYFGSKDLTKHVLFNLIKNALWAIKENDKGEIFITLKIDDKFNYLIFKDTGIGIPKERLPGLFQQLNARAEGGGIGLGLAFCKMVMNSYGGDITCDSEQGDYTEFTLSFPKEGGEATTLRQKISVRKA